MRVAFIAVLSNIFLWNHEVNSFIIIKNPTSVSRSLRLYQYSSSPTNGSDDEFLRDLQDAKQRIGASIPPEQQKASAQSAERDFLAAMKQVSQEFKSFKAEHGSDGAIDLIKNQWDEDERLSEIDDDDFNGEFQ